MYNLQSEFNIQEHKKNYYNYLEVIIYPDGLIEYATPSHQEKLLSICKKKLNLTRKEIYDMCPPDYYSDVITWLCQMTGCISVWASHIISGGPLTREQCESLMNLRFHRLYEGEINYED